jgi:hypothetical protein
MLAEAVLLAAILHAPYAYVELVYSWGGLDAVCVVNYESQFNPRCRRAEPEGDSFGLFQLYSKYHKQYRTDIVRHVIAGSAFLAGCKRKGGTLAKGYSVYNSGTTWKSIKAGREVERRRDELARFVYGIA